MTKTIKEYIKIANETFDTIMNTDNFDADIEVLENKYSVNRATLMGYVNRYYRYRLIPPMPTDDEKNLYTEKLNEHSKKASKPYNFDLIDEMLKADADGSLEDFVLHTNKNTLSKLMDKFVTYGADSASVMKKVKIVYGKVIAIYNRAVLEGKISEKTKYSNYDNSERAKVTETKRNEKLDATKQIIQEYLGSQDLLPDKLFPKYFFNKNLFAKYSELLKDADDESKKIYDEYIKTLNDRELSISLIIKDAALKMNSLNYKFNMFDLYQECLSVCKMGLNEFLSYCRYLSTHDLLTKDEVRLFERFAFNHDDGNIAVDEEKIKREEYSYNGKSLTPEEKNQLVDYFKNNNIPMSRNNFNGATEKVLDGKLDLEKAKKI